MSLAVNVWFLVCMTDPVDFLNPRSCIGSAPAIWRTLAMGVTTTILLPEEY